MRVPNRKTVILPVMCLITLILCIQTVWGQSTRRVNVTSSGGESPYAAARPSISGDGNRVVFDAWDLVLNPGESNFDIFVHYMDTGVTSKITQAGGPHASYSPSISTDGRWVAFRSTGKDFDPNIYDPNAWHKIYVADIDNPGTFEYVSKSTNGQIANSGSQRPDISGNGRHVVFESYATDLTPEVDVNATWDIFVHDRQTGITSLVSKSISGTTGNGGCGFPVISDNGRFVAFWSWATDLVNNDANGGVMDIFARDRDPDGNGIFDEGNEVTTIVSLSSSGDQPDNSCLWPSISEDGRYVAFESWATNLVSPDIAFSDIFVVDRDVDEDGIFDEPGAIETTIASVNSLGSQSGMGSCYLSRLSTDGSRVAFYSAAQGLVWNQGIYNDVYVHDRNTKQTYLVSIDSQGNFSNGDCGINYWSDGGIAISGDGTRVAFYSYADNLVAGDTNGLADIFVHDVCPDPAIEIGYPKVGGNSLYPYFHACGELGSGQQAELILRHAPASTPTWLAVSVTANTSYLPVIDGTLVPFPWQFMILLSTNTDGEVSVVAPGGGGPFDVYMQWFMVDAGATKGIGLSNAKRVFFQP